MRSPPSQGSIDALVAWLCRAIARACQLEPTAVTAESRVVELGLDSLSLVSVLTLIEAEHGFELGTEETLALLEAADVRSLACTLSTIIDAQRSDASG